MASAGGAGIASLEAPVWLGAVAADMGGVDASGGVDGDAAGAADPAIGGLSGVGDVWAAATSGLPHMASSAAAECSMNRVMVMVLSFTFRG